MLRGRVQSLKQFEVHYALKPTLPSRQTHHGHTENAVAEKFESKKGHFCKVLTLAAATEESFMITNGGRQCLLKANSFKWFCRLPVS